jgi:hypothetical protein
LGEVEFSIIELHWWHKGLLSVSKGPKVGKNNQIYDFFGIPNDFWEITSRLIYFAGTLGAFELVKGSN